MTLVVRALHVEADGRRLLAVDKLIAPASTCTVITGPGDAGKTLLALALAGAAPATRAATLTLDGRPLDGPPSARARAGLAVVAGTPLRLRGITVAEALDLAPRRRATPRRTRDDALARFPLLAARRTLPCDRLSGGEHQLLRIACAWITTPRALVLDSPTTGLAGALAQDVVTLAQEEARRGAAVLWLDQPNAPLPAEPAHRLDAGRLSAPAESRTESPTGSA